MGTDEISLGNFRVRFHDFDTDLSLPIKQKTAELIDLLQNYIQNEHINPTHVERIDFSEMKNMLKEKTRLIEAAQLNYENACLWAVKAVTLK